MSEKLPAGAAARLREIAGEKNYLEGDDIGLDFGHDEYPCAESHMPCAVVEPQSTEQVSEILKLCSELGMPVTVRGAGTGQAGGSVPLDGGLVMSMKGMNAILGVDEAGMSMTVQCGALLQDVKAAASGAGLWYPPDPGEQTATIGGNAATNAGGPLSVKYGRTADYILDAVFVKADGTVCHLIDSPANKAVIGSEGTLGVITELKLKLIKKPGADTILLLPFMDCDSAVAAAGTMGEQGFSPAATEYMDTDLIEFSGKATGNPVFPVTMGGERLAATLMVTIEGNDDDDVMEKMEGVAELADEFECVDILVGDSPTMKRDFWDAHSAFHTSMESGCKSSWEVNVDVAPEDIPELISFAKKQGGKAGFKVMVNAHVMSGGVHIHIASDLSRGEASESAEALIASVYKKCAALGGDIVGEYGVGYAKVEHLKNAVCAEKYAALRQTKRLFDPNGILNPGKVLAD